MQPSTTQRPKPHSSSAGKASRIAAAFALAFFVALILPALMPAAAPATRVHAATASDGSDGSTIPFWGPLVYCTGNYNDIVKGNTAVTRKCESLCDLIATVQRFVNFAITLVLFVGVPVMFLIGGFTFMTSAGNEERRSSAKKTIVSAVIGVAIMLGAYVILNTFLHLMGNGTGQVQVAWPAVSCSVPGNTPVTP